MPEHSAWSESSDGDCDKKTVQEPEPESEPQREPEQEKEESMSAVPAAEPDREILEFEDGDPENPYNWSTTKKILVLLSIINAINNTNLGSTLATGVESFTEHFHVSNKIELTIPTGMYMTGYIIGPTIAGPMSEHYGRRWVLAGSFSFYTIFSLACVGAPNFGALAAFRLLMGMGAAVPLSVIGGTCADMYKDTIDRGRAIGFFITAAAFGAVVGPIISGYTSVREWNLPFWVGSGIALGSLLILLITPETYGPALLRSKARKARKSGRTNVYAQIELQSESVLSKMKALCIRAPKMFVMEPLVLNICVFMAFIYGVFYVFFQAYHRVYQGGYKMTAGQAGLTFISLGIGHTLPGFAISLWYDRRLKRLEKEGKLEGQDKEETLRMPLACIGSVMLVVALFWTGAAASRPHTVHWIVPVLALIPFGAGYMLIYTAFSNYLIDSYAKYAASAMAAGTMTRSLMAATLPLVSGLMYDKLGLQWGFFLLGFVMLALGTIPFVFWKYGYRLRQRSSMCQQLRAEKEEQEENEREKERGSSASRKELGKEVV